MDLRGEIFFKRCDNYHTPPPAKPRGRCAISMYLFWDISTQKWLRCISFGRAANFLVLLTGKVTLDCLKMHGWDSPYSFWWSPHHASISYIFANSLSRCTLFGRSDQKADFDVPLLTFLRSIEMYTPSDGPLRPDYCHTDIIRARSALIVASKLYFYFHFFRIPFGGDQNMK